MCQNVPKMYPKCTQNVPKMAINCQKIDHTFVEVVKKGQDAKVSKRPETNAEVVGGDGAEAVDDEAVENSVSFFEFSVRFCKKIW